MLRAFLSVFVLAFSVTHCCNSCSGKDTIYSIVGVEECQEVCELLGEISMRSIVEELEGKLGSYLFWTRPQLKTDEQFAKQYEHRALFGGSDPEEFLLVADEPLVALGGSANADAFQLEIWSMEMRSGVLEARDNLEIRRASKKTKVNLKR